MKKYVLEVDTPKFLETIKSIDCENKRFEIFEGHHHTHLTFKTALEEHLDAEISLIDYISLKHILKTNENGVAVFYGANLPERYVARKIQNAADVWVSKNSRSFSEEHWPYRRDPDLQQFMAHAVEKSLGLETGFQREASKTERKILDILKENPSSLETIITYMTKNLTNSLEKAEENKFDEITNCYLYATKSLKKYLIPDNVRQTAKKQACLAKFDTVSRELID